MSKKNNLNYIPASAKTAAQKKDDAKQKQSRPSSGELSAEARKKLLKKRVWTLSVISLSFISEPVTVQPRESRISAIAESPMPPTPIQ